MTGRPAGIAGPSATAAALRYARRSRGRFVAQLAAFCRFPGVSAQPARAADVRRCADWLAGHLRAVGLTRVQVRAAGGAPVVTAEAVAGPGRPTLLVYGHYDVQPAEPLAAWATP